MTKKSENGGDYELTGRGEGGFLSLSGPAASADDFRRRATFEVLFQPTVASRAAITGPGAGTNFFDGTDTEDGYGVNDDVFRNLQAVTDHPARAGRAVTRRCGVHGTAIFQQG